MDLDWGREYQACRSRLKGTNNVVDLCTFYAIFLWIQTFLKKKKNAYFKNTYIGNLLGLKPRTTS